MTPAAAIPAYPIAATCPIAGALQRAGLVRRLDRLTGGVLPGCGGRLARARR